jgi:hypothetical protein
VKSLITTTVKPLQLSVEVPTTLKNRGIYNVLMKRWLLKFLFNGTGPIQTTTTSRPLHAVHYANTPPEHAQLLLLGTTFLWVEKLVSQTCGTLLVLQEAP